MRNRYALDPNFVRAKRSKKKIAWSIVYYLVGTTLSLAFILPLLYMFAASTKDRDGIAQSYGTIMMFIPNFGNSSVIGQNYGFIFAEKEIWKYALNTIIYAAVIIVFNVIINGLAGYVLAKFKFPGKGFFNFIILFLIVVPVETSILPLYSVVNDLLGFNARNNLNFIGVMLPSMISVFNIFLYTQFFSSIPKEYEEAMHIDGASRFRMFFDLILPTSKPIIATTAVFSFIGVWNDYVWPRMMLPARAMGDTSWPLETIQAALTSIQEGGSSISPGQIMAALVVTTVPIFIVYTIAQKYIVKGFGTAGLKM